MNPTGSDLRFDRATYTKGPDTGVPCASCKGALGDSYWRWQQHTICGRCREGIARQLADSQSNKRLAKAVLTGGATALACGIAYAMFVSATHIQFALATIGIAFVIARVVRKASGGIGGTRFQVVAVALTYLSATMGYIPGIWGALRDASAKHHAAEAASKDSPSSPEAAATSSSAPEAAKPKPSVGGLLVAVAWLVGLMLAAPFLEATEAPLGLLIVGFGLWEAWKLSRGPPARLEGPFRVGAPPDPAA
jgi:hypothetical protein